MESTFCFSCASTCAVFLSSVQQSAAVFPACSPLWWLRWRERPVSIVYSQSLDSVLSNQAVLDCGGGWVGGWGVVRGYGHWHFTHWNVAVCAITCSCTALIALDWAFYLGTLALAFARVDFFNWLCPLPFLLLFEIKCKYDWPHFIAFMSANFWHFNKVLRNERSISSKVAWITVI